MFERWRDSWFGRYTWHDGWRSLMHNAIAITVMVAVLCALFWLSEHSGVR